MFIIKHECGDVHCYCSEYQTQEPDKPWRANWDQILASDGNYCIQQFQEMAEKAYNADNVTLINQQKYAESLSGKLGELSATWEKIGNDTIDSTFLKGLADAGIGISSLIEKIGLLKSVIASVGIAAFVKNFA